ncbi:redoxin domain-containing protein [Pseudomonadota bacterium]
MVTLTGLSIPASADSGDIQDFDAVPHIDAKARAEYRTFLSMPRHRAFAIAPGGAWGWTESEASRQRAEAAAVAGCETYTDQRCVVYAVNDEIVFDRTGWARLWGPYLDRDNAERAVTGVKRGQRFPDLAFEQGDDRTGSISAFHGKVVLLHFWGTWCTYCVPELTELQALYDELEGSDIEFVLLQVREPYAVTRKWLDAEGFSLPQYDSGVSETGHDGLRLADGRPIRDRELALVFPTTYVLDRHGIVVFRRIGPALRWREYIPLLRDVAARSGE